MSSNNVLQMKGANTDMTAPRNNSNENECKNGKADFYLKIIGVLVCILMALLSWVTVTAISANETQHKDIKQMIVSMSQANGERIKDIDRRITEFIANAPPAHEHHADGSLLRKLK